MDQQLQKAIAEWIAEQLPDYLRECGGQYRIYLIEDAVGQFCRPEDGDLHAQVIAYCRQLLDGVQ